MKIGLLTVSSYPGTATTTKGVALDAADHEPLRPRVSGKRVVLVDDILDSGNTLRATSRLMRDLGAADVRTCVLLRKQDRPEAADVVADYAGFDIPDAFVVGYGLDYDDEYRNLPNICVLKPGVFASGN
jgi:hypoxanthine phosphoribosyltransferase